MSEKTPDKKKFTVSVGRGSDGGRARYENCTSAYVDHVGDLVIEDEDGTVAHYPKGHFSSFERERD